MTDRKVCAFCDSEITSINDSKEHVIPNSIGGRKKIRGFLCLTCNNSFGQSWDATLATQLNWFSLAVGIERDRSNNPDQIVRTVDGTELLLRANGTMTRKDPFFEITEFEGKARIRLFARNEREYREMLRGIKKKYPNFDLDGELKNIQVMPFRVDSPQQYRLELGGPVAGRSLVKTAIAECAAVGILPYRCEIGIRTLKTPSDNSGFALFYIRDIVVNRPKDMLFHLVAILGDSEKGFLLAYVEYFGVMRVMVKLSSKYEGESFTSVYAINPQSSENLDLFVNWDIPTNEMDAAFNGFGVVKKNFDFACKNATAIASHSRLKRERQYVYREELSSVLSQLGIQPGGILESKDRERFNRLMDEKVGSFSELIKEHPKMPTPKK